MALENSPAGGVAATTPAGSRVRPIGPGAALVFALASAFAFAVSDAIGPLRDDLDALFLLSGLIGWILLGWTVLVTVAASVALVGRIARRRDVSRLEFALLAGALTLIALEAGLHPLWGAGAGFGG